MLHVTSSNKDAGQTGYRTFITFINRQAGFSVVEIILAAAIFLIFSSAAVFVTLQGFDANRTGNEETIANEYASEGIEAMRSIRDQNYTALTDTNGTSVVGSGGSWALGVDGTTNTFGKYTRSIAIADVYRDTPDSSGNIVSSTTAGSVLDPSTKKVTSTVTWNVTSARSDTVSQSVYLTNWQAPIVWFDPGYAFKKMITIDHTKVAGGADLTNFPVLIRFTDPNLIAQSQPGNICGSGNGCVQSDNGYDIIFTDANQTTKLDHEIEKYFKATGQIIMWVRVPVISASKDTVIYMYYDNPALASGPTQENVSGVWSNNYAGVWHLKENPGGSAPQMTDSTSSPNSGTSFGGMTSSNQVTGKIDGSLNFLSSSLQYIDMGTDPTNHKFDFGTGDFSLDAWFYVPSLPSAWSPIINKGGWGYIGYGMSISSSNNLTCDIDAIDSTHNQHAYSGATVSVGWNYGYCTFPRSDKIYTYLNGVPTATAYLAGNDTSSITNSGMDFKLADITSTYFNGQIDEAHVANVARTSGWVSTEYNNQSSPATFFSISAAMGK